MTEESPVPSEPAPEAEAQPPTPADVETPKKKAKPQPPRKPVDPAIVRAHRDGTPVDGLIEKIIKGGYEIRVGACRGFCPHSQMDIHRVEDPEGHVGKTFAFRILQRRGDDLVLSRRALLEESRLEESKAVRATLIEGHVMQGRVARIAEFGAFVDLGAGVTGLVHVTELSHARIARVEDAVQPGDRVMVKITKLDEETGRIGLSIRQALADPWEGLEDRLRPGTPVSGTVKRLAEFGAFVEIAPGVEALAPAREFPPVAGGWRSLCEPGTSREWTVLSHEVAKRRVSVIPVVGEAFLSRDEQPVPGTTRKGLVQRAEGFGLFVWLGPGHVGLVPRVWTGTPPGARLETKFPQGAEIEVDIVDVLDDGRKIRLGVTGVDRAPGDVEEPRKAPPREKAPRREAESRREPPRPPAPSESPEAPAFGTSLGDLLRAAMDRRGR